MLPALPALALAASLAAPAWIPDPPGARGARADGPTWTAEGPGYRARLTMLTEEERWAHLRDLAGAAADPFAPAPGKEPGFLAFLLEIDNRSTAALGFHPGNCRLITNHRSVGYPLDLPSLEASLAMTGRAMPPAWSKVGEALLDGESTLPPGGRASGLLVFRVPEPRTRSFRVEVVLSTAGEEGADFTASYRRAKKDGGR